MGDESLWASVKQSEIDDGQRAGLSTTGRVELEQLRKDNLELRRVTDILQAAASFFEADLDCQHE